MARIRSIKPEFFKDRRLGCELTRDQRLFYVGLWPNADDEGRLLLVERTLLGDIFPFEDDLDEKWVRETLETLQASGRCVLYEVDGDQYIQLTKFKDHQKIDKPSKSRMPPPPNDLQDPPGTLPEDSPKPPGALPESSANPPGDSIEASTPGSRILDLGSSTSTSSSFHSEDGRGPIVENHDQVCEPPSIDQQTPEQAFKTVMGWVREFAWLGSLPDRQAEAQDANIVKEWVGLIRGRPRSRTGIRDALVGFRRLIDSGKLEWLEPRKPARILRLHNTKSNNRDLYTMAQAHAHSGGRKKRSRSTAAPVGQVLAGMARR